MGANRINIQGKYQGTVQIIEPSKNAWWILIAAEKVSDKKNIPFVQIPMTNNDIDKYKFSEGDKVIFTVTNEKKGEIEADILYNHLEKKNYSNYFIRGLAKAEAVK